MTRKQSQRCVMNWDQYLPSLGVWSTYSEPFSSIARALKHRRYLYRQCGGNVKSIQIQELS